MDSSELENVSCLPAAVRKVLVHAKWVSSQRSAFVFLVPVVLILLLFLSDALAESAVSQLLFWKCYFSEFGCPSDVQNQHTLTQTTVTLAGVKVPEGWPVFDDPRVVCRCFSCDGEAITGKSSCGPKWAPGAVGEDLYGCALRSKNPQQHLRASRRASNESNAKVGDASSASSTLDVQNHTLKAPKVHLGYDAMLLGFMGGEDYAEPILLNTHHLPVAEKASKNCTGELVVEEERTDLISLLIEAYLKYKVTKAHYLDGWCDCSSGVFVPAAHDRIWHRWAWSGAWTAKGVTSFLSAEREDHPMWTETWLKRQERHADYNVHTAQDFAKTPLPNPGRPFQDFFQSYGPFGRTFASISELYHYLFVDVVWGYISWFISDLRGAMEWLFLEVLTLESLIASLKIWLDVEAQLEKLKYIVVWTRSASAFILGIWAGLT